MTKEVREVLAEVLAIASALLLFSTLAVCLILTSCGGQPEEKNWLVQSWAQVQGVWESESYTDQNGEIHSLAYSETHELMISGDSIVSTYCGSSNAGRIWLWAIDDETYISYNYWLNNWIYKRYLWCDT